MASGSAERRKRELRRQARADPQRGDAVAVQRRLLTTPELRAARTVALYAALPGEVPIEPVADELEQRGVTVVFPRVHEQALVFHAARADQLTPGFRGILEPDAALPHVPLGRIDLFVVPGLRFDPCGRRLGRGLGFYDRALAQARDAARRVGLCYADGVLGELPEAEWDVRVHLIVTERNVLRPEDVR